MLPSIINFPLAQISVTPYLPVPETNGEEWDRLEIASALDVLVELAIHGEYSGVDVKRTKESLELRAAAAAVFEVDPIHKNCYHFIHLFGDRTLFARMTFDMQSYKGCFEVNILPSFHGLKYLLLIQILDLDLAPASKPLLHALIAPPNITSKLDPADVMSTHIACLMFSHLLRGSPRAKSLASQVIPGSAPVAEPQSNLFIPADGTPSAPPAEEHENEDENQTVLQVLNENLSLSLLSRSRTDTFDREAREWDRYVVGYLCLLSQWLWEDPKSVREFLDGGGLGVVSRVSQRDCDFHDTNISSITFS